MAANMNESWATPDVACANCRSRKIRCGREKPRCGSCCRDEVECVYSSPPKRVNHVKVLCQNFSSIQDRLILVQEDVASLTSMFRQSNLTERPRAQPSDHLPHLEDSGMENSHKILVPAAGHIARDGSTLIERYHGPWSLIAQCRDLGADLIAHKGSDNAMSILAKKFSQRAEPDDPQDFADIPADDAIRLPPKQFLTVMLDSFFKLDDPHTDIFTPETTYEALERVYREPSSSFSAPWAVCFNVIILVVLGIDSAVGVDNTFVRPVLQAAHAAIRKISLFLAPRLVNVQALAVLSFFAHQYHIESLGDPLFAQACILAKTMGLHHSERGPEPSENIPNEETERLKVFRSLYIRDRNATIARGAMSWLHQSTPKPSSPCPHDERSSSGSSPQGGDLSTGYYKPHYELAKLQDELHSLLSMGILQPCASDSRVTLARLERRLEAWSQRHKVPSPSRPTTVHDVSLHLNFLGTRIQLKQAYTYNELDSSTLLLHDARLCCLLLVTSCGHPANDALVDRLSCLLSAMSMPTSNDRGAQWASMSSSSSTTSSNAASIPDASEPNTPVERLSLQRLVGTFPTAALFLLARHILSLDLFPNSSASHSTLATARHYNEPSETFEDMTLLKTLQSTIRDSNNTTKDHLPTYSNKLGRVIQDIMELIDAANLQNQLYDGTQAPAAISLLSQEAPSRQLSSPNQELYLESMAGMTPGNPWPVTRVQESLSTLNSDLIFEGGLGESQFDISHFLDQSGVADRIWDDPRAGQSTQEQDTVGGELVVLQRAKKRPRTKDYEDVGNWSEYTSAS